MPFRPQDQGDILYTPSRERVITTNAWAFLRWIAAARGIRLADWAALQNWSVAEPAGFASAVGKFARLPDSFDATRLRQNADLLLHFDLRPDDTLLVANASDWSEAARYVTSVTTHDPCPPGALLRVAAQTGVSVLAAPAAQLDGAAFRLPAGRLDLARLRLVIALGGPMPANARVRLYTWVKPDLMLLARAGDTVWGDPLSPVLRAPPARPALCVTLRPPPSPDQDAR
ncbi:MAG: hypothetical protein J0H14_14225 [Alphaproteobacteria bacterium]|nr:hypothetical protein [Alphaproteobacteria bacterium]